MTASLVGASTPQTPSVEDGDTITYETGGEDTALAKLMLKNGFGIVLEPALTVHHSHGLGLRDSVKQELHQLQTVRAPKQFDRQELLECRPDLRANG